jgi:hypothetical protein
VEGKILPSVPQSLASDYRQTKECSLPGTETVILPSLGPKLVGIRAIQIFSPVHAHQGEADRCAFRYEDGLFPVRAAAYGKDCVLVCCALVCWNWRDETEGYIGVSIRLNVKGDCLTDIL